MKAPVLRWQRPKAQRADVGQVRAGKGSAWPRRVGGAARAEATPVLADSGQSLLSLSPQPPAAACGWSCQHPEGRSS